MSSTEMWQGVALFCLFISFTVVGTGALGVLFCTASLAAYIWLLSLTD